MRAEVLEDIQLELEILQTLSQDTSIDGIGRMIDYFEDFTQLVMVLEYLNGEDLLKWFLKCERTLTEIR